MKILILGASGMLGSAVATEFDSINQEVITTTRVQSAKPLAGRENRLFNASVDFVHNIASDLSAGDFIINCIGVIKPYIRDDSEDQRKNAIQVNSLFPHQLAELGATHGVKTIQIATDCVFSGAKGGYSEADFHDATDVYGKTKSLGEVPSEFLMHLRASIIGKEVGRQTSLLEWVLSQEKDGSINGFTDHVWNGVTTNHFGKLARGIVENNLFSPGVQHLVPGNVVTKFDLVSTIAQRFGRQDIKINPTESSLRIDRTLSTINSSLNSTLWGAAGYRQPPSVEGMVSEIAEKLQATAI